MQHLASVVTVGALLTLAGSACGQLSFTEASADLGLADLRGPHCCFVDLDNDGRPDAVVGRNRVFLNTPAEALGPDTETRHGLRFVEVEKTGLPAFRRGDIAVFADLDNDGIKDCLWTRYLDVHADNYQAPTEGPPATAWLRGNGDGTFGQPIGSWELIAQATEATTTSVALGDINRDGRLDLYLGNWYRQYGAGLDAYRNDVLLQAKHGTRFVAEWCEETPEALDARTREMGAERVEPSIAGEAVEAVEPDLGGRPTYGVFVVDLHSSSRRLGLQLLELNYGRRANRLWGADAEFSQRDEVSASPGDPWWADQATDLSLDGDPIRHGRHPEWLKERAKTDPRFDRDDEKPFRSHGNTFDAAIGDIDNDGDFDLFVAEITHGWAGESSDRSRFLVQDDSGAFVSPPGLSVDRAPRDPTVQSWNQGDIYCELADFDLDGRLDLLLCSSDYPDNQRLRIYRQQTDSTFVDITDWIGIDHVGAGQPSLADIDADGDLDIMVGQSFNRLRRDQRAGREPRVRVYVNQAADRGLGKALVLRLAGDPASGVAHDALGAIVRVTTTIGGERVTQTRQLLGIGGHQGKQSDFAVHVGVGDARVVERVEIEWPTEREEITVLGDVEPREYLIRLE